MTALRVGIATASVGLALVMGVAAQKGAPKPAPQSWTELAVQNFGAPINTRWGEGELSFADDGTMVLTSGREDLAVAPGDPRDLYIASFNKETGTWDAPVNMGLPVNAPPATNVDPLRKGDDREPWITPDGATIYFKSDRLATSTPRNANDIFVTHKVNGKWSTPQLVAGPVSTNDGNEHCPMLLRDGRTLCFASERSGGYGSSDIWCVQRDAGGQWGPAVNQGPTINTAGSEFHFMQSRDGQWVYFTSTRPGGYGGADIWASRHLGPNKWGAAVNLGPRVNTAAADMCPALGPGDQAFCWFAARPGNTLGSTDIYWTLKQNIDRDMNVAHQPPPQKGAGAVHEH
jgi:hypothetical protein